MRNTAIAISPLQVKNQFGNYMFALLSERWRAIKEKSKGANRDWVDHQACSLLQYINVTANLFINKNKTLSH